MLSNASLSRLSSQCCKHAIRNPSIVPSTSRFVSNTSESLPSKPRKYAHARTPSVNIDTTAPRVSHPSQTRTRPPRIPVDGTGRGPKRLLDPYTLAQRLKDLSAKGELDEAINMLKNSPLDAQNIVVWGTMMSLCLKAQRYQVAYQLYIDSKRRGFIPTRHTYNTMLSGLFPIKDWSTHTKQLENAHALYDNYIQYAESIKSQDPNSPHISTAPINSYLRVLASAGLYQKIFDVYYSMDEHGPLAPSAYTYSTLFTIISERQRPSPDSTTSIDVQNASDTRLIWRQMLKHAERDPTVIDAFCISPALRCLSRGRPPDQLLAFDIVREYVGLAKPGEVATPKVPPNPYLLQAVLELCNQTRKFRLCTQWLEEFMDRPLTQKDSPVVDRIHVEQALIAYASMAAMGSLNEPQQALKLLQRALDEAALSTEQGRSIRPTLSTYGLVMMVCWRGGDWETAINVFDLMTGYQAKDFSDGQTGVPRMEKRSKGRNVSPDNIFMSNMARAALASRDRSNMRQCLRIINHYGADYFFEDARVATKHGEYGEGDGKKSSGKLSSRLLAYYTNKLARAVAELVKETVPKKKSDVEVEETRWLELKGRAEKVLHSVTMRHQIGTFVPPLEEDMLGSMRGLAATESRVDFDRATRART